MILERDVAGDGFLFDRAEGRIGGVAIVAVVLFFAGWIRAGVDDDSAGIRLGWLDDRGDTLVLVGFGSTWFFKWNRGGDVNGFF